MHDYNSSARMYWWTVAVAGTLLLAHALFSMASLPTPSMLQVALATAFVGAVAFFPVEIPGSKISVAAGEIVIFLVLFLHGAEAAAIVAAVEGAIGAARTSKRWTSWFGTPAMAAIATSISGYGFLAARTALDRQGQLTGVTMIALLTVFALVYWALCNILPSLVLALKRSERLNLVSLAKDRSWMAVSHLLGAAIAANLYYAGATIGLWVLMAVLPLMVISLVSAHFLLRRAQTGNS